MVTVSVMTTVARLGFATLGLSVATAAFALAGQAGGKPAAPGTQTPVATQPAPAAAAQPAAAAGGDVVAKGRELFTNWSCNSCHTLGDAGATGHVGPSLDGDANLTKDFVVNRVTNGQGAMPAFGGQMTDEEINTIATYIVQVHAK